MNLDALIAVAVGNDTSEALQGPLLNDNVRTGLETRSTNSDV